MRPPSYAVAAKLTIFAEDSRNASVGAIEEGDDSGKYPFTL